MADFTFLATWNGFVYVAFVIDVFCRMIVGWRAAASMKTDLVLDALEQALYQEKAKTALYLSIRNSERLAASRIQASVGTTGDSYDNAIAESIIGLYKTELIR